MYQTQLNLSLRDWNFFQAAKSSYYQHEKYICIRNMEIEESTKVLMQKLK